MKKNLVLYHGNCADGFGAAFAAWLVLGDEDTDYVPVRYEEPLPCEVKGRQVYILDFSFPKETMQTIINEADYTTQLDHHKTAFESWCGTFHKGDILSETGRNYRILLNDNKSGALLAWEHFHKDAAPMLIRHIDDYDRWQFKIAGTKEFCKALWMAAPWSFSQWKLLSEGVGYQEMIEIGSAVLRVHDQNVAKVVEGGGRPCTITIEPYIWRGWAANAPPHLSSDVGHELANLSGTFGLVWCLDKDGVTAKCSLRSNGADVSAIAKCFGGGGHNNAAGFQVPAATLLGWMK